MKEVLSSLGLAEKEAEIYLLLLETGQHTASVIAKKTNESRTNTYMLLENMLEKGVIVQDDSGVKRFNAASPQSLQLILKTRQQELNGISSQLQSYLPELTSKYNLVNHRPGVIYRQGIDGFKESLLDIERCGDEVLIIPSHITPENEEAYAMLQKALARRKAKGVLSRCVLHVGGKDYTDIHQWPIKGIDVRFLGSEYYEGEVVIYADKCTFTVYDPQIIVTTITNSTIADTMRTVFENLWRSAEVLKK